MASGSSSGGNRAKKLAIAAAFSKRERVPATAADVATSSAKPASVLELSSMLP